MKKYKLDTFTRGWVLGNFEKSIFPVKEFEFMVRYYKEGDTELKHVHKIADEITVIVSGKFLMNGEILEAGDVVHLAPGDPSDFKCLEDGANAVVKRPSVMGDKYIVE
jgi:quercetin dioxygenase-like cupin family protein